MGNYEVFIKLSLVNQVSAGLAAMSGQFSKLNAQAAAVEAKLNSIKKMAFVGAGLAGAGFFGLHLFEKALKPAEEYAHQLNIMNMAGLSQKEIAEAVGSAWENTHKVITSSATENLRMLNDMRIVFGKMDEAQRALPLVSQMQAVLMSSKEGKAVASDKDFAFSVAKALDIIGAVKDKEQFEKQAVMMAKTITAFQGRVSPKMFQSTFAYARQAKYALDDEFKYQFLPTLMMEYASSGGGGGGGSRGVGPMIAAMYRFTNQGYINKKSLPELESLGLVNKNTALKTTTSGTTVGPMKDYQLAGRDPLLWVTKTLLPALETKYGKNLSNEQIQFHINQIARGNQLAASLMTEFALKSFAFFRDQALINKSMSPEQAYQRALINDPVLARQALAEQWNNVQVALTTPIVTVLIPAMVHLANGLNYLSEILIKYPKLAATLSYAFVGLSASMAFGGTVTLLAAGFRSIGVALAFFGGGSVLSGIAAGFSAIAAAVGPLLAVLGVGYASYKGATALGAGKLGSSIGNKIYDWTHPSEAHILDSTPYTGKGKRQTIQVNSTIHLDGRKVAQAVTAHQVTSARSPNLTTRFDGSMSFIPAMLNQPSY